MAGKSRTIKNHYVPQMLLRNFSVIGNKDRINAFDVLQEARRDNQHTANVAFEKLFYPQHIEDAFTELEDRLAPIFLDVIANDKLPDTDSPEYQDILVFTMLQSSRTKSVTDDLNEFINKTANYLINSDASDASEQSKRKDASNCQYELNDPAIMTLHMCVDSLPFMHDMAMCVILNKTDTPFIISDDPAIRTNPYLDCKLKQQRNNTGFASLGLIMVLPIGPHHAIMIYDPKVYRVHDSVVECAGRMDVYILNLLQASSAVRYMFFNDELDDARLDRLVCESTNYKIVDSLIVEECEVVGPMRGRGKLIHIHGDSLKMKGMLSFAPVYEHIWNSVLPLQSVYLRDYELMEQFTDVKMRYAKGTTVDEYLDGLVRKPN